MKKTLVLIRDGALVTVCSIIGLILSFVIYVIAFMYFEKITNGNYYFVTPLRLIHGIVWLILGLVLYKTKIIDWLKASILTISVATFLISAGVTLYTKPIFTSISIFLVLMISLLALLRKGMKWYHYYALILALAAVMSYL